MSYYYTCISEGHRPDLHPNGALVRCVENKGNGYLLVSNVTESNFFLIHEKYLKLALC